MTEQNEATRPQKTTHTHDYQVECMNRVIIRWCRTCGVTDLLEPYKSGGYPITWTHIQERSGKFGVKDGNNEITQR